MISSFHVNLSSLFLFVALGTCLFNFLCKNCRILLFSFNFLRCRFVFGKPISAQAPVAANLLHFTSIYSIHSQEFTYHPKTIRQVATTTTETLRNLTFLSLSSHIVCNSILLFFWFHFENRIFKSLVCFSIPSLSLSQLKLVSSVFSFLVLFCFALVYQEIFICCVWGQARRIQKCV